MSKQTKSRKRLTVDLRKRFKGFCCRYFAFPIETPEDWDDYDDIRWYLAHKNISAFAEDGEWYLNVKNKCRHLSEKDYKCQIYHKRPKICREYNPDNCDFTNGQYDYDLYFEDDRQMEAYMWVKFPQKAAKKLGGSRSKAKCL